MQEIIEILKKIGLEAGQLALNMRVRNADLQVHELKDSHDSYSVEADIRVEKFIFENLRKLMPVPFGILSEESGTAQSNDNLTIVVDPIDGTYNYTRGLPDFGVSLGIVVGNRAVGGVIYLPVENLLLWAYDGQGAFCNDEPLQFKPNYPKRMIGIEGSSMRMPPDLIPRVRGVGHWQRRECAVAGFAYTALNRYDALFTEYLRPWDVAAGIPILREAGATITDFNGEEPTILSEFIVAGLPQTHRELCEHLKTIVNLAQNDF